jgi:hypothetical protein
MALRRASRRSVRSRARPSLLIDSRPSAGVAPALRARAFVVAAVALMERRRRTGAFYVGAGAVAGRQLHALFPSRGEAEYLRRAAEELFQGVKVAGPGPSDLAADPASDVPVGALAGVGPSEDPGGDLVDLVGQALMCEAVLGRRSFELSVGLSVHRSPAGSRSGHGR